MKNSRLHQVLEVLSPKDVKNLTHFIQSKYFNQREDLIILWDYLSDRIFNLNIIPDKREIFEAVYPQQIYEAQQVRLIMSLLLRIIEQFLACESFLGDEARVKLRLIRLYREKKVPKLFKYKIREFKAIQQKKGYQNARYFDENYQMQVERYQFTASDQRIGEQNFQEISDNLDLAFISRKLRQACLSLSHQAVYKAAYRFGLLPELLTFVETEKLLDYPSISVYYHCYQALTGQEQETHFKAFKKLIFDRSSTFPKNELKDLYLLAINYCIKRLNDGDKEYAREGLDLYKEGLHAGIIISDNQMSRFTYRNIVALALIVGDYEWVATFINDFKSALKKEHRDSMYSFSLARLEYQRRNFPEALRLLQQAAYKDLLLLLGAKTMQLKIYYETDQWDLLHAHLEAMKHFIRRKKVMGYHRTNYLNIIRYTRKLVHTNHFDKQAVNQLRKEIEEEEVLTEREWLLAQMSDL